MVAVPATQFVSMEFQDKQGFRATTRVDAMFNPDIPIDATTLATIYGGLNGIAAATAAMSNAKLVGVTIGYRYGIAQEPTTETGVYELVIQKAHLEGGDGAGAFESISVPAPKDALFLTSGQDNMIVVNPAATILSGGSGFQHAFTVGGVNNSARGGTVFSLFFGGQIREGKPRRRRVLQGA